MQQRLLSPTTADRNRLRLCLPVLEVEPHLLSQLDGGLVHRRGHHRERLACLRINGIGNLTGMAVFQRQHDRFADVDPPSRMTSRMAWVT